MFQNAESRRRNEEATERREHYLAHWLPLIPEAPADFIPLQGIPPAQQCKEVERSMKQDSYGHHYN